MKKILALILALIIISLSVFALIFSKNPAGINYSPNTGDTPWEMIIFIGLGVIAAILLVFVGMKRRK
ncbi:MAG: LPXTG cell wall anchor domain-containing protein [Oscillospiraceae bacterium]|nr:LPXTG cell wall anchor domain-containing protein [Oscillospiraceae bacterium]